MEEKDALYKQSIQDAELMIDAAKAVFITEVKMLRNRLSLTEQSILNYDSHVDNSVFQLSDARKSILLAKAWLGKILSILGEENPYKKDGERVKVQDIEPESDKVEYIEEPHVGTFIEYIDVQRESIKQDISFCNSLNDELLNFYVKYDDLPVETTNYIRSFEVELNTVIIHLSEARFKLGYILGSIRDNNNNK